MHFVSNIYVKIPNTRERSAHPEAPTSIGTFSISYTPFEDSLIRNYEKKMRILSACHFDVSLCDVFIESQKYRTIYKKENKMTGINQLTMVSVVVSDMPRAKEFYAEKLGLQVATDFRQNDDNWWVTLTPPGGGPSITLARSSTTSNEAPKPGTMGLYFSTPDIAAAHGALKEKGVEVGKVRDNLYGPGSGVKFIQFQDPDGNSVTIAQE
jgi:catechol 2,3-dioxygenase-like lactoylglutathione lyase family enzyme